MEKRDLTRLLGWPGYRVYRYEVDEAAGTLKVWVRKKPLHRGFACSGCGRRVHAVVATWEREVADLDCFEFRTTVVIDVHRLNCVECGPKVEKIEQVPSKAPYTKRFEDRVGQAVRVQRRGEWRGSSGCPRAPCALSICGIWKGGPRNGARLR